MPDPTNFLLARITEDEEMAGSGWSRDPAERWLRTDEGLAILSPQAVLAECETKRRIIRDARQAIRTSDDVPEDEPDELNNNGRKHGHAQAFEVVLEHLVQPYANHPDFDPSWRP